MRRLPFTWPATPTAAAARRERSGTCASKHALLREDLATLGLMALPMLVTGPLVPDVLADDPAFANELDLLEVHEYLTILTPCAGPVRADVTATQQVSGAPARAASMGGAAHIRTNIAITGGPATRSAVYRAGVHARIDDLVGAHAAELVRIRRDLHAHPELSNREARTAAVVAGHLETLGLDEVRTGIAGHGVVGVLRGGRPGNRVSALRADMDALPVRETSGEAFASTVVDETYPGGPFPVAHACGHDCHTATVLTAASVLAAVRDDLPGTVLFVFQPAEEGPPVDEVGGAKAMLDAGALDDPAPTMVFGMHVSPFPIGHVAYRVGNQFAASCLVRIVITGVPVHGSTPWMGVDPMPAAAATITGAAQLYRQVPAWDPVTVTFGHVEDTGRFNVIGATVTLWGTLRCSVEAGMGDLQDRLRRLADHTALAHGCSAEVDFLQPVPPVRNTRAWVDATLPTLRRVVGADRVVASPPTLVYDDVSELVNRFGGVYLQYGVQETTFDDGVLVPAAGGRGLVPNHHPGFYAEDGALATSVRIHAHVAIDHLTGTLDVGA